MTPRPILIGLWAAPLLSALGLPAHAAPATAPRELAAPALPAPVADGPDSARFDLTVQNARRPRRCSPSCR